MLATFIACKNDQPCEKCGLRRCCPVKLEFRLQSLEAESEKRSQWPSWLVVDILGLDSRKASPDGWFHHEPD